MQMDDFVDAAFGMFLSAVALAAIALVIGIGVDTIQSRRAFEARAACRVKRMEVARQVWSTRVVCIPANSRQDTSTVNVTGLSRGE